MRKIKIMLALLWAYALTVSAQDVQYLPLHDDAAITGRTVDTELKVGFTAGALNVSPTGGASYTIPIALPPGTKGVVPSLSIGYNSQGGNGIMGMGWNISGLSAITRTGKNLHYDGQVSTVQLNSNDFYALDGNRLEATSTNVYSTKMETFSKITATVNTYGNPEWFKVETKGGITYEYGNTADSKYYDASVSAIISWQINKMTDQYGNYVKYVYEVNGREMRIKEILYTGSDAFLPYNKIAFNYKNRIIDKTTQYIAGSSVALNSILTEIVVTTEGGVQAKKYAFEYGHDHIHSFLNAVKEYGSDNSELNNTIFKYGNPVISMAQVNSQGFIGEIIGTGDFNGDGLKDILTGTFITHSTGAKFLDKIRVYRKNNNSDGLFTLSYSKQIDNSGDVRTIYNGWDVQSVNPVAQDFNGDGRDDIMLLVVHDYNSPTFKYTDARFDIFQANETATDFTVGNASNPNDALSRSLSYGNGIYNVCWSQIPAKTNYLKFGDFDGDGKTDILAILEKCESTNTGDAIKAFLFTPATRFSTACGGSCPPYPIIISTGQATDWLEADDLSVLDFDGDGKMDIMVTKKLSSEKTQKKVYRFINTDDRGSFSSDNKMAELIYDSNELPKGEKEFKIADFNGDSKADIVGFNKATNTWYLYKSTGSALVSQSFNPSFTNFNEFNVGDFNGDGLSDILITQSVPIGLLNNTFHEIHFSNGNGFVSKIFTESRDAAFVKEKFVAADFNGDGKTDIYNGFQSSESSTLPVILSFNPLSKDGTLDKIANGFNQVTEIDYKYLTESGVYTKNKASVYPFNVITAPIKVATYVATPNGIGGNIKTFYEYENAQVHRKGLGFLGFSKFDTRVYTALESYPPTAQGTRTTTEFKIIESTTTPQYPIAHYAVVVDKQTVRAQSRVAALDNELLSETANDYSFVTNGTRYWQKLNTTTSKNKKTGVETTASYVYDVYGNVTNETATTKTLNNSNEETVTSTKSFTGTYGTTVPAHPETVVVSKKRSNVPFPTEAANIFTYNAKGDVTNKIDNTRELGIVTDLSSTFYNYNSMGLVVSTGMYSNGIAPRYSSNTYDAKGRFALTSTNTLGQTASKTYDPRWGSVLTETDITGLITSYVYDGFGRVIQVTTPQQHNITTDYRWAYEAESLPLRAYDVITTTPGKPQTWDTYDAAGRLVVATHQGYGDVNSRNVYTYTVTEYDARGNVARKSTPVNVNNWSNEVEFTSFNYDYLNRLTSEANAIGSTAYAYSYDVNKGQSTVTVTTPSGQTSSKTTDATGKTLSTTDHGGTLTFEYDNRGNQTSVKMDGSVITSMTYDRKGHQKTLTDQNSGTTEYLYDNYGQLKWQKDARNSEYTMDYDALGRLITRTGPEGTTTNEYVTSGYGLNAIKKVTSFNGLLQEYTYDNWHRIAAITETIDGTAYTKTFAYNAFNDLLSTTYPTGLVTTDWYSTDGYMFKVTANNGQILFDGTNGEISGFGKWRSYTLGNGVTSNIAYNHFAMPTSYRAGNNQEQNNRQNLVLNWNLQTGNLNSRADGIKSKTEEFMYDNLNRLTTTQISGLQTYTFNFADNGNIDHKDDAGYYNYGGNKPNAVADVNINLWHGGTIPSTTQDITYTKFQRPELITEGSMNLSFLYASDYERRKTVLRHGDEIVNRRYYLGDYEIDRDVNGVTRHIHYISGGDGLCAIVVKEGTSGAFQYFFPYTDHLGSILTVTSDNGSIVAEQNFDAWGRKRNATTWDYANVGTVPDWLYRGFTGHEHLPEFGLINMNARLYDPVLGRMLSADNYLGAGTQGLNRYSYAGNNPLNRVDPDGNMPILATMAIFAAVNLATDLIVSKGNMNFEQIALSIGSGALSGALGGGGMSVGNTFLAAGLGQANRFLPSISLIKENNFNLSISPMIGLGTGGYTLGGSINASGVTDGGFAWGLSAGFGYNSGTNSLGETHGEALSGKAVGQSWYWNAGGFAGYNDGHANYGLGISSNTFSGKTGQRVGAGTIQIGDFGIRIDEDIIPFFGDGGDRYRTGGVLATYRVNDDVTLAAGLSMMTGERGYFTGEGVNVNPNIPEGRYGTATGYHNTHVAGILYGGAIYKGQSFFAGHNSEKRLHAVQDPMHKSRFIVGGKTRLFTGMGLEPKFYSYYGSYHSNYLFY